MDWTCAQVTRLLFGVRLYHRGKLPNAVKCCQTCRALEQLVWVCACVLIGALSQSTANGLLRSSNLIFWASKSENSLWERSCVCSVFQQKVQRAMQRYRSAPSSIDSKWLGFPSNICFPQGQIGFKSSCMFHHHMALPLKLPLPQWTGISHQNSNSQSHFSSTSSLASFPLLSINSTWNIFPALSLHLTMTLLCDRACLHVQTSSLKPLVHVMINVGVTGLIPCSTFRVLPHNTYWCIRQL